MLNPEGLAELGNDFTGKYIIHRIASQVTVLRIYHPNRGERIQKKEPTLCLNQNREGWANPEHFTRSVFDDSDQVRHPPSLLGARSRRPDPISPPPLTPSCDAGRSRKDPSNLRTRGQGVFSRPTVQPNRRKPPLRPQVLRPICFGARLLPWPRAQIKC